MQESQVYFIELAIANKAKFVCDITEHFYNSNKTVCIYANSTKDATQIDQLLWTWKQDSFVPHAMTSAQNNEPIVIDTGQQSIPEKDVLILFDPLDPKVFSNYAYIIDFAEIYDTQKLQASRKRYKDARNLEQYKLEFIKLGAFLNLKF